MVVQSTKLNIGKDFSVQSEIPTDEVDRYFEDFEVFKALKPLKYEVHLVNQGKFIAFDADVDTALELCCFRCGATFTREIKTHISLKLIEASSVGDTDEIVLSEEDLDTITYVAPNIELNDILLESIYLELDDECLCSPDCKGVCLNCGKNLNEGPCSCP